MRYRTLWCAASTRKLCFWFNRRSNVVSVFPYISRHIMALNTIKIIISNCDIKQTDRHDGVIVTILRVCRLKRPKKQKKKNFLQRYASIYNLLQNYYYLYIIILLRILCTNCCPDISIPQSQSIRHKKYW